MTGNEAARRHVPVLLEEVLDGLRIRQGGVYLDGTLGGGGHAREILERYAGTRVIGLDRDPEALEEAAGTLAGYGDRALLHRMDFRRMAEAIRASGLQRVDGIILDLGVSSMQLESDRRGFSFTREGPLDMRMDPDQGCPASEIVNSWDREDLARLLTRYGEEKRARSIAAAIVRERATAPITTTGHLARVVTSVPGMNRIRNIHPATRTFQALRIEVNDELGALEEAIPEGVKHLVDGGRMAVISFHSLEDRIVKRSFRRLESPCTCPRELPECRCGKVSEGKVITRKPVVPSAEEVGTNPRSRSARLRIFEKGGGKGKGKGDKAWQ
ncbi:MAG: 16S rRNA (cytosine(1402)-N(4))-methyltransferase RsmH [bacterium]|nr:MAG: 16S rRNA (cytosine(1402)-N(4))-methyltransferase RsmH [bacterium]